MPIIKCAHFSINILYMWEHAQKVRPKFSKKEIKQGSAGSAVQCIPVITWAAVFCCC